MKTKFHNILAAFFLVAVSHLGIAQNFEWVRQIGGLHEKQSNAIAVDGSENIFVTGWFRGTIDFDPGPDTLNLTSAGGSDIFICKLNPQGNLMWAKSLGGSVVVQNDVLTDHANSVVIDNVGDIYISGGFWGTVDFDPGPDTVSLTSTEEFANFICKFDASGNFLWVREYGKNISQPNTVAVDNDNNVYLAGRSEGLIDIYSSIDSLDYEYNLFVVKFDPTGNVLWENVWVNYMWDTGSSIFLDSEGNAYITGSYFARTDFDPSEETFYLSDMDDDDQTPDAFILKLDSSGNLVWAKQIGGVDYEVGGPCVVDSYGNIYLYGSFTSETDFDPSPELYNLSNIYSICLVKLNNLGELLWAKPIEGEILPGDIAIDENANIYLTGSFNGTVDFDLNESVISYKSFWSDIFITKWDSAGNFKWFNRLKNPDNFVNNLGISLSVHKNEIYATGTFEGTVNVEINSSEQSFTSQGNSDILIYKMSQTATAISNPSFNSAISVYPNPTSDKLNIVFGKIHPEITASVKNILGQEIISEKYNNVENFQLSMDGFMPGIYFIHLRDKNEQKVAVLKVVKSK